MLDNIIDEGGSGFAQQLDVTSGEDWDAFYQAVLNQWDSLDVLINNAGVAAAGRLEDSSIEDWQWVLDIDLLGERIRMLLEQKSEILALVLLRLLVCHFFI